MNAPEGAFIWVLPSAAERHGAFLARSLTLLGQSPETIMAAHAIALERGAEEARRVINHPEAGSEPFIEALRMTYAQVLAAPMVIANYPMPIKGGTILDASVINPFISCKSDEDRTRIKTRYEDFLRGDRIEIWAKRQNTLKFLKIDEAAEKRFCEDLGSGEYPNAE
jgi:hypothetical protein